MKKICLTVIGIGTLGMLLCMLLRVWGYTTGSLFNISYVILLTGLLFLPTVSSRPPRRQWHRVFQVIAGTGIILVIASHVLILLKSHEYHSIAVAGYSILIACLGFIIIMGIVNRLRTSPRGKPTSVETLISLGLTVEDLSKYEGVYNNSKIPLKITITCREATLIAQATGQSAFYLEATAPTVFRYTDRDITIEFKSTEELVLQQRGGLFTFIRER